MLIAQAQKGTQRLLRYALLFGGVSIFVLIVVGVILLEQAESCRFPRHLLKEEYRYKIDLKQPFLAERFRAGKTAEITGPKLQTIYLDQEYGTYTVLTDSTPSLSDVVFRVENRAKEKFYLPRMTAMSAELIDHNTTVGDEVRVEKRANLFINSTTSNEQSGNVTCRRADVTIVIPSACLLEDSTLNIKVMKGHITTKGLNKANFDTLRFENDEGNIEAHETQSYRADLVTKRGVLDARNVTAHYMLMATSEDGGVIAARDVTLFSGDDGATCRTNVTYPKGFPRTAKYAKKVVTCDQEEGTLTVDSTGAENGGHPAIELERVVGGHISSKIKVGHTRATVKACADVTGNFTITAPFGKRNARVEAPAANRVDALTGLGGPRTFDFFDSTSGPKANMLSGNICNNKTGFANRNQTYAFESLTTGNIDLIVLPPTV